jgi:hypothetical protein
MSNIKTFLKALQKSDYPNSSMSVPTIAKFVNYNIDDFLPELHKTIGEEKTEEFIHNTFYKLGASYNPGVEIDLSDEVGESGSYIYLIINGFDIKSPMFIDDNEVWIHYSWGKSHLIHDGEEKTLDDIYDDVDMGDLGEWDELIDDIQEVCIQTLYEKTGFILHFDSQI